MNPSLTPVSKPSSGAGTRDRILEAARTDFAEYGQAGARVDRIARSAGVNKAMIYYHFHSKEDLHREVVGEFFRRMIGRVQAQASEFGTLEQVFRAIADTHIHMCLSEPELVRIVLRELADPRTEALDQMTSVLVTSGLPTSVARTMETAMARGDLRTVDVRQTIVSFLTMSLGYFIMAPILERVWGITDRTAFLDERRDAMVDLLMNGLKAR
jgi:TetR/AcrR family transcriptional regulator